MKAYKQNKFLYLNLTFILIVIILSLSLIACTKQENDIENTNKATSTTIENNKTDNLVDTSSKEDVIYKYYYGEDDKYNASIIISKFTTKDLEDIKSEYGEKSDEYLRLNDDMPEYKIKMNLKYVGDGIDNFQDINELNLNIKNLNSSFDTNIKGNQEITKVLTGNIPFYEDYIYNDSSRNEISKESNEFNVSGKFNNDKLNFNIGLEEKEWK